ncbi:hypothetical protein C5C31_09335 [Rathayibacter rathayi]|uniref:HNH endonuclease n=1 Tax=Rathayibacter rathayi TaxID=33887 RepID=A0ABD6W5R1_RATRA|nr:hypothetical protein [Rathayibacter rathayi]AZZ49885.1 hypothetical protein C1O28_12400 [Rathayibacter rathayi]MWV75956.1 hypothetical protein [Rathayibacter rathayi NCPPB 2980 = VKM Ac-1601]PPF09579.1 hypothetical protein C5C04_14630 [Rathayibacter rathayi]PPF18158.1 hypothetical protein C5C34_15560 [Rathayibacter rathayi]PPF41684.1 hypothetical protein C5C08_15925 [Rathayibacter rathayi]
MTDPTLAVLNDLIAALAHPGAIDPGLSRSVVARAVALRLQPARTAYRPRPSSRFTGRLVSPGEAARRALARRRVVVRAGLTTRLEQNRRLKWGQ